MRTRGVWETYVPSSQFCCDPKTLLKHKILKKKKKRKEKKKNGGYFGNISQYFKYFLLIGKCLRDVFIYVKMTSRTLLFQ